MVKHLIFSYEVVLTWLRQTGQLVCNRTAVICVVHLVQTVISLNQGHDLEKVTLL